MRITRLGQGVDVTGELAPEAVARTVQVLAEYRALCDRHSVSRMRVTATSAARDARNREQFFDAVQQALGTRPELISGEEEARLSFLGATADLPSNDAPFLIMDIGGGSTELALGTTAPEALVSLPLGCVRMSERHFRSDPPSAVELAACFADIERTLAAASVIDRARAKTVVGLAGTVTTLSALQLGLRAYDATRTHHSTLTQEQAQRGFEQLSRASLAQRRQLLAEPGRAEVIVGGAAVLLTLLRVLDIQSLLVSEHDILDGLVASVRTT